MSNNELHSPDEWSPAVINGLFSLVTAATNFFLPIFFREELGYRGSQIGLLFALHALAGSLAAFPAGLANDWVTSRRLVLAGLVLQAISFVLMANVSPFLLFMPVFFLWSLAFNLYRVSFDVHLMKNGQGASLPRRVLLFHGLRFGGLALGTMAAGYLLESLDFRVTLMLIAATCLALALSARNLPDTQASRVQLADYRADLSKPTTILFALWLFLFAVHWGVEYTCYGLFLRQNLRLSLIDMGWYMAVEFATISVLLVVLLRRKASFEESEALRQMAILGLILSGVGHVGMTIPLLSLSLAFRMIHGCGDALIMLLFYLGIAKLFDSQRVGGNTGFFDLARMSGLVAGSLIAGPLGESWGYAAPIMASGLLTLALALPLFSLRARAWGRPT